MTHIQLGLCFLIGVFLTIWFLVQFVGRARRFVNYRLDLDRVMIQKMALFLAAFCFILINPLYHVIISAAAIVLYYFIVDKSGLRSLNDFINKKSKPSYKSTSVELSSNYSSIKLELKPKEELDATTIRKRLERCLFSFPFLDDDHKIELYKLSGSYHLNVPLVSNKYIASLISYLEKSGFETQLKNN